MSEELNELRGQAMVWIVVGVLVLAGLGIGAVMGFLSPRKGLFERTPAPQPSQADAAGVAIPTGGVRVTVKQNDKGWLPGGEYQLHLDDITGRQVLVSATDAKGRVVFGPTSVKKGSAFAIPSEERPVVRVKVARLENMLAGGDFGEFLVLPPTADVSNSSEDQTGWR